MSVKNAVQKVPISELFARFETFLFDADGVLWTGNTPVPGAIEFIDRILKEEGKKVFILTNNSTRTLDQYTEKIKKIGFGNVQKENILTSAIVMAEYLKSKPEKYRGKEVYMIGTENLKKTLEEESGVHCYGLGPDSMDDYAGTDAMSDLPLDFGRQPVAVICSFDAHFSYPKIMKAANYLARSGVEFLVTNEDVTFPSQRPGIIVPGSGATSYCLRAVSGREPIVFGKPSKSMADLLKSRGQLDPSKTIMFGDRLDTDIAFGNVNGFSTCLMLTGVHSIEDAKRLSTSPICFEDKKPEDGAAATQQPPKQQGWFSKILTGQQMDPSGWQKQSHSSLLSTSDYIYEFTTHNYRPGSIDAYLDKFGKYKDELSNKSPSTELVGSWTVNFGRTKDQAVHLWRHKHGYSDLDKVINLHLHDSALRAIDNEVASMCGRRKNIMVKSFSYWREPQSRSPTHIYDLRSYVLQPGTMIEWANAWAKGITFRREHNQDVGGFFAQVGQLYVVYHIWAYPSMAARNDTRHSTWAKPGWDATVAYTVPLIKKMQSKILSPTKYSQLQ